MTTNKASVEIKLGRTAGVPTVRATAREVRWEIDEVGIRKRIVGRVIAGFDMNVEPIERWKSRKGGFGKLYYHVLQQLKGLLEADTMCKVCERGQVFFKKSRKDGYYTAEWVALSFQEHGVCQKCWAWMHPLRNHFNPRPEFDDDGAEFDNIYSDAVNEPFRANRDELLEDIDFMIALDAHETRQFLGTGTDGRIDDHTSWLLHQGAD